VSPTERAGGSVDSSTSDDAAASPSPGGSSDDTGGTRRRASTDPRREAPARRSERSESATRRAGANLARLRQVGLADEVAVEPRQKAAPTTPPGRVIRPASRLDQTGELPVQRSRSNRPPASRVDQTGELPVQRSRSNRPPSGRERAANGDGAAPDEAAASRAPGGTDDCASAATATSAAVPTLPPIEIPEIVPAVPYVAPTAEPATEAVSPAIIAELNAAPAPTLFDDEAVPDATSASGVRRRRRPRVRKVTRVVRHVDPWSVFKVAIIFGLVLYGILLTAGVLLWNVAQDTGTVDNLERWFEDWGWTTFELNGGELYHAAWIGGLFGVVGLIGFAVLVATLFNLATDLVGGIRMTVLEEEVVARDTPPLRRFVLTRRPMRPSPAAGGVGRGTAVAAVETAVMATKPATTATTTVAATTSTGTPSNATPSNATTATEPVSETLDAALAPATIKPVED
jgi:hypothetical protein